MVRTSFYTCLIRKLILKTNLIFIHYFCFLQPFSAYDVNSSVPLLGASSVLWTECHSIHESLTEANYLLKLHVLKFFSLTICKNHATTWLMIIYFRLYVNYYHKFIGKWITAILTFSGLSSKSNGIQDLMILKNEKRYGERRKVTK